MLRRLRSRERLQSAFNVASILLLGACVGLVLKNIGGGGAPKGEEVLLPEVGTRISVPHAEWSHTRANLIFALSLECPYCDRSYPFYRELLSPLNRPHLHTIAMLPESQGVSTAFLEQEGVTFDSVQQVDPQKSVVLGTPTIILADRSGSVLRAWRGLLSEEDELEVFKLLRLERKPQLRQYAGANDASTDQMDATQLRNEEQKGAVLLDIRRRENFAQGHIHAALNIPRDELLDRAAHEIEARTRIIILCQRDCPCRPTKAAPAGNSCKAAKSLLHKIGYSDVGLFNVGTDMLSMFETGNHEAHTQEN